LIAAQARVGEGEGMDADCPLEQDQPMVSKNQPECGCGLSKGVSL